MVARRAIFLAKADVDRIAVARQEVYVCKVALGERGSVWWDDDAPDYTRVLAVNSPYRDWHQEHFGK
jgi:hypothetical protein